ncbi:NAD-dependent succinate-semialdehyde dehydrogenase [bacterium]|nr:NAD-dependent succinate-semialdehyde dehydrogenase [bacterium]
MTDPYTELAIAGAWRAAADGARFAVREPATGAELASVADATVDDALAAVAAAHAAGPGWATAPPRQRSDVLRRAFELMLTRADRLAELIVRENGKPIAEARGEVAYAAEFFRWFSEEAVRLDGRFATAPGGGNRMLVLRQPIGVALLITPWNFPAAMATRKIGPALAAGCTVVLKPATETPLTALAVAAILAEAGAPPGVVNVVPTTRNAAVAAAMLADPRVRKLSFTGSTEVGRLLLAQAAQRVVKCSMELGGNAPFIVFADADLDAAIAGAMIAKMRHNGEACTAANRFYVERAVADEFSDRLARAMGGLAMGNGLDPAVRVGPLVNAETRAKVARLVDAARGAGARVRVGGTAPSGPGFFYPPTVLDRVAPDSPILAEEIFGPVAPVVAFDAEEEAIRLANATEYGLVSYVYTRDLGRALRVAEALEAGMVALNRGIVSDPAAPFGGIKQSGLGREGGPEGILEYTETKYVAVSW